VGGKDAESRPSPKAHCARVQFALTVPTIRDRVVQTAAVLVLEPIFEADMQPEQYAYRAERSALDAVQHVHKLINTGHGQIVDADLSSYFDSIPHTELMKSVARRVVDGAMLQLIKMWLEVPVEDTDERGNTHRSTRNRDEGRGTPQGSPISPLLSNLYMRRFVLGWKKLGHEERWKAYIVNYADDLVICCRVGAEQALTAMRRLMTKLKLTVNENKTRVCTLPAEKFDFLGYTFGRCYSMRRGRSYLGTKPSKKRVQRICRAISEDTGRDTLGQSWQTIVGKLNRKMIGWANYFVWERSAEPTVRWTFTPAVGCVGGSATNTMKRDRAISIFRKHLFIPCTVWCSYHTVPRAFRGRARESFPRAGCGRSASPVR
jgi:RNA-directed DNA polymerase